jgi:hypothetical protein
LAPRRCSPCSPAPLRARGCGEAGGARTTDSTAIRRAEAPGGFRRRGWWRNALRFSALVWGLFCQGLFHRSIAVSLFD